MATLQFPGIAQGSTAGWDVPLKSDLAALNTDIASLFAAVSGLSTGTSSPFGALVNVRDYGAVGNGSTDDSAAIATARDIVIASKTVTGQCTKALYFPAGQYRVTVPGTLMFTPDVSAGTAQTQVKSFMIIGDGKRRSQIYYDHSGPAAVGRHPADNALFIAGNRVNQLRVRGIGFLSTVATNTCFFFWSRTGSGTGTGGAFPEYGTGNNQDTVFEDVEFSGNWAWCFLLDGDITTTLNSELFCRNIATASTSTFAQAFFQCGYTAFATNDQQDQMVNYSFIDCKIEYAYGTAFVFNRGGVVRFMGGSYICGISNPTNNPATFFKTNDVSFHNAGVMNASFYSIRFQLLTTNCRIFDVQGWYGEGGHISMYDCNDVGHSPSTDGPITQAAIFRTHNGSIPQVRVQNCYLGGYWQVLGGQTSYGRLKFDQCGFYNWKGGIGTIAAATSFVRYDTATVPKVTYIDCPNVANLSN
jgi:hypothetical protein